MNRLRSKSFPENPKSAIQNRKLVGAVALVVTFAMCGAVATAQQPTKVPRIGYLSVASLSGMADRIEAFRQGLRELGYVEGKNIVIDWRYAEEKPDRVSELAAELVRLKVDVIVSGGNSATQAAKKATSTIPIVMTQASDPVASGFVASLARPGGNVTGLSRLAPEITGKRLELLKEIVPKFSRIAVLGTSTSPGHPQELREVEVAAGALGVKVQYLDVLTSKDLKTAFRDAGKWRADAVLMMVSGAVTNYLRKDIVELAVKNRVPVIYESARSVETGGLMTYGVNLSDLDRRAATYVDKILKGAQAADLPVEQPTKFEFVINLKAAKQIGLTIPPNVLTRADRVIK
jgi:putative ABC transport system substrate-binding protein